MNDVMFDTLNDLRLGMASRDIKIAKLEKELASEKKERDRLFAIIMSDMSETEARKTAKQKAAEREGVE